MGHYKNLLCLKKITTFLFYPGFLCEGSRLEIHSLKYLSLNKSLKSNKQNIRKNIPINLNMIIRYILFFKKS